MDIDKLYVGFITAYIKYPLSNMVDALDEYLHTDAFLPFHSNQHWVYLTSQMKRLKYDRSALGSSFPTELPGMVYGMYTNAWSKLLEDMNVDTVNSNPNRSSNAYRNEP